MGLVLGTTATGVPVTRKAVGLLEGPLNAKRDVGDDPGTPPVQLYQVGPPRWH